MAQGGQRKFMLRGRPTATNQVAPSLTENSKIINEIVACVNRYFDEKLWNVIIYKCFDVNGD